MTLEGAINASRIHAARGFDEKNNCVVSVAFYGDELVWLEGWGGNWDKKWKKVDEAGREKLLTLNFYPTGSKPEEEIEREVIAAITEILDDDFDDFEPMGESYE